VYVQLSWVIKKIKTVLKREECEEYISTSLVDKKENELKKLIDWSELVMRVRLQDN